MNYNSEAQYWYTSSRIIPTCCRPYGTCSTPCAAFVQLNHARTEEVIERSIYWYSIWSHTRPGQWKGYLQVDLSPSHDAVARVKLETGRQ